MKDYLQEDLKDIAEEIQKLEINNQTFFITGATGLVGSILVKGILTGNAVFNNNNKVVALVRNQEKAVRVFEEYTSGEDLEICVGDVNDFYQYSENIDYIVHAASETKSLNMVQHPVETFWTSINGSRNALEFARVKRVKGMVYLSSMEVYGQTSKIGSPIYEKDLGYLDIEKVRSCYPESKRAIENLCACYAKEYNLPVCSARLAQTFGAGVDISENRVFAQFAKSAIRGENIVLHTKGLSYGNYVYLSDAVKAILLLLVKGKAGTSYTVANQNTFIRIADMAKMVAECFGHGKSKVVFDIPKDIESMGYSADTCVHLSSEKLQSIGWKPKYDLKESYRRIIGYWMQIGVK